MVLAQSIASILKAYGIHTLHAISQQSHQHVKCKTPCTLQHCYIAGYSTMVEYIVAAHHRSSYFIAYLKVSTKQLCSFKYNPVQV